jgi:hypothetical protein
MSVCLTQGDQDVKLKITTLMIHPKIRIRLPECIVEQKYKNRLCADH